MQLCSLPVIYLEPNYGGGNEDNSNLFLGPRAHKVLFVPSKSLFPQSCVSSGSSLVKLKVTSSKRAYAIPRSSKPRAPAPEADIRKRWQEYTEELYRKDQIITKV